MALNYKKHDQFNPLSYLYLGIGLVYSDVVGGIIYGIVIGAFNCAEIHFQRDVMVKNVSTLLLHHTGFDYYWSVLYDACEVNSLR